MHTALPHRTCKGIHELHIAEKKLNGGGKSAPTKDYNKIFYHWF